MSEYRLTLTDPSLSPPSPKLVKVTIDGIELEVPQGENILEAAKRIGIDVPFFCYHPRLSKGDAANCRMCLVDVATLANDGTLRKMPKPQTACTLPASEGLVIDTKSERVTKDRRGILEFLLINHPLDCPICDRGGECPLQNNTLFYGPPASRYIEEKRHFPKAYPLSDYVVFDRERCIHCARCTRFTEDISGDSQLGFLKRGADMEVGTFAHTAYTSKFSGNVIELCPVGALLSRTYRFKARPWDLLTQRSVCTQCSNGCNTKIDYRVNQLQRVNARLNEDVNEEWTCDKGKFGHGYISSAERMTRPMVKRDAKWAPIEWQDAYSLLVAKLKTAGRDVGGIGGGRCTNEDNYAFQKLFRETLGSANVDSRIGRHQGPTANPLYRRLGYHAMGNAIADLEKMQTVFVLGADLVNEQPIIFLRIRKAWRYRGVSVVSAVSHEPEESTKVGDFAAIELRYKAGTEHALLNGILAALFAENLLPEPDRPTLAPLRSSIAEWTPARAAQETGVPAEQIAAAARLMAKAPMAVIAGAAVREHPHFDVIAAALADLAIATGNAGNINVPGAECNTQGAADMGVLPDSGPGYAPVATKGMTTHEMLEAAVSGSLGALWLVGANLIERYHDRALAERALEKCPFVVVNELTMTETAQRADMVLPVASVAEKDGTYTNCERRVQAIHKCFDFARDVKPDWLVFAEVAEAFTHQASYFSARDILGEISERVPIYRGINFDTVGESGVRWHYPADNK